MGYLDVVATGIVPTGLAECARGPGSVVARPLAPRPETSPPMSSPRSSWHSQGLSACPARRRIIRAGLKSTALRRVAEYPLRASARLRLMAACIEEHQSQTPRPRSERRQRQTMVAARVNSDEERRIREAARAQNISVARLIRNAVLAAVDQFTAA